MKSDNKNVLKRRFHLIKHYGILKSEHKVYNTVFCCTMTVKRHSYNFGFMFEHCVSVIIV